MDDQKKAIRDKHMIDFRGKDYLPVFARLLMFNVDNKDFRYCISTEFVEFMGMPYMKCTISDGMGEPGRIATAHKRIKGKGEGKGPAAEWPLETAETGAIGRALAIMGYGTEEAGEDLDEGGDLADSPIQTNKRPSSGKQEQQQTGDLEV